MDYAAGGTTMVGTVGGVLATTGAMGSSLIATVAGGLLITGSGLFYAMAKRRQRADVKSAS